MAGGKLHKLFARGWRNVQATGHRRVLLTALFVLAALVVARFSWFLPLTAQAEQGLYDLRESRLAAEVPQDPRILMIVYNDQTLINLRKRSPLDRGLLAKVLRNLDGMGAKAIGIDILFDQPQDEDDELVATLRAMKTPVSVGYAETSVNTADIGFNQQAYLDSFIARLKGSRARPASVALSNAEGVTRLWPPINPKLPPTLARSMLQSAGEGDKALPGYDGAIRYSWPADTTAPLFSTLPIDTLVDPQIVPALRPAVEGRYVLIGGDLVDFDRVETPLTSESTETPSGLSIHATFIAQMLDGARLPRPTPLALWSLAILFVGAAALTGLLELRSLWIYPALIVQTVFLVGVPFLMHWQGTDTYGLPAAGWVLGWIVSFAAVTSAARASGAVQRRFAQGALGKYLPREMAQEIIERPELLALHGEKKDIFVLFSDLEGFTQMSHALEPEVVARLLNRYLETLSQVVLANGGVIDKFVGDAVVAFWGAPIARADDGVRAARAGHALWLAGEGFRNSVEAGLPPVGRTRVGLHFGAAVVGNFGGESRIQYTALGDAMNTASRLESANKQLETSVLASREFVERCAVDWWRPMGRVVLRGRAQPVDVFDAAPEFPEAERHELAKALASVCENPEEAVRLLTRVVHRNPADRALQNLLRRTQHLNQEGAYVLD
jgi:adenylate cyclase